MERIKLNLIPSGVAPIVHLSQYDDGRKFGIDLFEGESVYVLDGTETLTVNSRKPDGHVVVLTVTNTGTSSLDVDTVEQLTAVHGVSYAKLQIVKGSVTIATLPFLIDVSRDPLENGDPSESFIQNLRTQIAEGVAEEVATQYDSSNVIFDNAPTSGHGTPYTVTSEGIKNAIDNAFDYDNTASGSLVHITDGADNIPVKSLTSEIVAVESGSGEKSPDNPYTISGFDNGIITVTDNDQITNTYTFTFGQTVYGGYFDNKGNLVITHKIIEFDYQSNWRFENILGGNFYVACGSDVKASQFGDDLSCNCSPSSSILAVTSNTCLISVAKNFNFTWGGTLGITNVDDFKTYLQTNNLVIKVKCLLANPITLSITSQDIPTLLGENCFYSNTGELEVNYYTSKSNDILEFIDSEIGKKNGTNIPIEENSQDSIKDYIDNVSLSGLSDTDISSPSASQVLSFDGNNWVNANQIVVKYEEKDITFDSSGEGTLYFANGYILGLKDIPSDSLYIGYITYMAGTKTMVKGFNRSATTFDSTAIANTTRKIGIYYLDNIATQ